MHLTLPRTAGLILSLVLAVSAALPSGAGELSRPVPSDARVTRFTRFNIRYALRDVVADGVQKVEFYITDDMGRTWRLYGEDADRTSPMTVQVPGEGVYGFVCVVTDRFGNREREPGPRSRPETVIVVDQTPPTAKWLSPTQNVLGKGQPVEFKWESHDPNFGPTPVTIQYAVNAKSNHDREANWQVLQDKLPASGTHLWNPPADSSGTFNFRLLAEDRAGNIVVAYNGATITVDSQPPVIKDVSPLTSNKLRVDITVQADDGPGGSGVKEISLYTSNNQGGTWTLVKERNDTGESVPVKRGSGQPIVFEAPGPGSYALWPVAFDEAGNGSPLPPIGATGPYVLTIDNEAPIVTLSDSFLMGRAAVLANDSRTVSWTAYDPHLQENSATIQLSLDNGSTWQDLRSSLPTSGSETISFPFGAQSEDAKLKVTVADTFGNIGEGVSPSFKLSAADTVIESVTPIGSSPQPDFTAPAPTTPAPSLPAPAYPTAPAFPEQPPQPSSPPQWGGGATAFPPGGFGVNPAAGESTAGSLPQAMLGTGAHGGQSTQLPPPPVQVPDQTPSLTPPPATSAPSAPASGWTPSQPLQPSPTQSSGPQLPPLVDSQPAWPPSPAATPSPTPPASAPSTDWSIPPLGDAATDWNQPSVPPPAADWTAPVAPPSAPEQPSAQPSAPAPTSASPFGDDWLGGATGGVQPPSLPPIGGGSDTGLSLPPLEESPFSGFDSPMPGFGDQAVPPPLPPQTATAEPAAGQPTDLGTSSSLRPPPPVAAPPSEAPAPVVPSAPALPAAPTTPPAASTPTLPAPTSSPLPDIPHFDDGMSPPPLPDAGASRPANPRQESEHFVTEARRYLDEGRVDLALDAGLKALNADETNQRAYITLSQAYVQQEPPDFARAANLAKEATNLAREDWESWWNCADIFYRWAHARNKVVQNQIRSGQRPAADMVDERNQALSNAQIAIGNASMLVARNASEADRKQVAITQGEIAYLRALIVPEPVRPAADAGPMAESQYRNEFAAYKTTVTPILLEALPFFQTAMQLDGAPSYRETFHLGIINFRLGGLERESGNVSQAANYYQEAARYLEQATTARGVPAEGPREAYYMLAYCYDQMADVPGANRARNKELALRYWRQTAEFYPPDTAYRTYAEQRMAALMEELGQ